MEFAIAPARNRNRTINLQPFSFESLRHLGEKRMKTNYWKTAIFALSAGFMFIAGNANASHHRAIGLTKLVNGQEARTPPGPMLEVGSEVTFTYIVKNFTDWPLSNVKVTDDQGYSVYCPADSLGARKTMECEAVAIVEAGQHKNVATVTANLGKRAVMAKDRARYFGKKKDNGEVGEEGCTPGFWRNEPTWTNTAYSPTDTIESAFTAVSTAFPALEGDTLLEALAYSGGPAAIDKASLLLRHAVAALLNASHPGVSYPMTVAEIQAAVNAALLTQDPATMEDLKDELEEFNELGCPIDRGEGLTFSTVF
jgi:hypothetical protein